MAVVRARGFPAEGLLDRALTEWTIRDRRTSREKAEAYQSLAETLARGNGDYLLTDMASGIQSERGGDALAGAVAADLSGDNARGIAKAGEAAKAFGAVGNRAATLRAREEVTYALSRASRTTECLLETEGLLRDLEASGRYPWMLVQTLLARATCEGRAGDPGVTRALKLKALQVAEDHALDVSWLRAKGLLATSGTLAGDWAAARRDDIEGLTRFWGGTFPALRGYQFYSDLTTLAEKNKRWYMAYLFSREATPLITLTGNRRTEAMALYRAGAFAMATDHAQEGEEEMRRGDAMLKGFGDGAPIRSLRAEQRILAANILLSRGEARKAMAVLEPIQAGDTESSILLKLGIHTALGETDLRLNEPEQARAEFAEAGEVADAALRKVGSARERATWQSAAAPVYRSLIRVLLKEGKSERALAVWQNYQSGSIAALPAGTNDEKALERVAAGLRTFSILSWIQFDDYIAGWLFDDRGIHSFRSEMSFRNAAARCSAFTAGAADPASGIEEIRKRGRELYEALFGAADPYLTRERTLLIQPDGPCAAIPFEALTDRQGTFLIDRGPLANVSGVFAPGRAVGRIRAGARAVIVGDPRLTGDFAERYPELPLALAEAEAVSGYFVNPIRLTGKAASRTAVAHAMGTGELFHFAGHGLEGSTTGALLLAPEERSRGAGFLDEEAVAPDMTRCRLVYLSACGSGRGETQGSFNPDSLVQAFRRAGAGAVVASRWTVDSEAALAMTKNFYAGLFSGKDAAESLRIAALNLRQRERFRHPAYWAAFHVFGGL